MRFYWPKVVHLFLLFLLIFAGRGKESLAGRFMGLFHSDAPTEHLHTDCITAFCCPFPLNAPPTTLQFSIHFRPLSSVSLFTSSSLLHTKHFHRESPSRLGKLRKSSAEIESYPSTANSLPPLFTAQLVFHDWPPRLSGLTVAQVEIFLSLTTNSSPASVTLTHSPPLGTETDPV